MIFSHAYLFIAETKDGTVKQSRLVYGAGNGSAARAFPAGKQAPENAVAATWDEEGFALTYYLDDGTDYTVTLSEQEIEDAKATEAL